MSQETSRPAQVWDTLEEAASAGDLQRFKDALAQWDDEDTDAQVEPNIAENFTPNRVVKRRLAMQSLLVASARAGHADVASYLLSERRCVVKAPAVRTAIRHKQWAVMQMFLDGGWWDINQPIEGNNTLPVLRDFLPSLEHVRWCLEHGADPNACSIGGNNHILATAASMAPVPVPVLRALRDIGGADFARSDALHLAVRAGAKTVGDEEARERRRTRLLGVLAYLVDEARFPVDQLEYAYNVDMFEGWRKYKALGTALHCAAKEQCITAVKSLLERGADKDIKDTHGKTAAEVSEEVGFEEGVAALR